MRFVLLLSIVSTALLFAACGHDDDHDAYATFQECYSDHTMVESLPPEQAIVICCIEHPIGSAAKNTVCGNDAAACSTYITANVTTGAPTSTQLTAGCNDYITQRGM